MPERLERLPELIAEQPRSIALMLPVSGPLATAGEAIRDGFMAAYYEALGGREDQGPSVSMVDTNGRGIEESWAEAMSIGADVVIGPLSKDDVAALAGRSRDLSVPVLALNAASTTRSAGPFYQFALRPETEGIQLARRLYAQNLRDVVLLHKDVSWAGRVRAAFLEEFEALGGRTLVDANFSETSEIGPTLEEALLVEESSERARAAQRAAGRNLETQPRRRGDVDAVVALTDPSSGRTLRPALDYYFASDLPVFATSHILPERGSRAAADLDGIRFSAMPWYVDPPALRREMEAAYPDASQDVSAFYAFGVDAWYLHAAIGRLEGGDSRMDGVTGDLSIDADGHVRRRVAWAVMGDDGMPERLPRVVRISSR